MGSLIMNIYLNYIPNDVYIFFTIQVLLVKCPFLGKPLGKVTVYIFVYINIIVEPSHVKLCKIYFSSDDIGQFPDHH